MPAAGRRGYSISFIFAQPLDEQGLRVGAGRIERSPECVPPDRSALVTRCRVRRMRSAEVIGLSYSGGRPITPQFVAL